MLCRLDKALFTASRLGLKTIIPLGQRCSSKNLQHKKGAWRNIWQCSAFPQLVHLTNRKGLKCFSSADQYHSSVLFTYLSRLRKALHTLRVTNGFQIANKGSNLPSLPFAIFKRGIKALYSVDRCSRNSPWSIPNMSEGCHNVCRRQVAARHGSIRYDGSLIRLSAPS